MNVVGGMIWKIWITVSFPLALLWSSPSTQARDTESGEREDRKVSEQNPKLLVIMLDGFRWDYYNNHKNELPGFTRFLREGVQAEWMEPVFPTVSYACWTSISTGVYPETHGVLGNYMFDLQRNVSFELDDDEKTGMEHWWQNAEPIWATATKNRRRTFLRFWGRCDVPFHNILPEVCTPYKGIDGVDIINETLIVAVDSLQKDFNLVMVHGDHIDLVGHRYGPDSPEMKQALIQIDHVLTEFMDRMVNTGLDGKVNVVILGDHGIKWQGEGSNTTYLSLEDYINVDDVYKVLDRGPVMAIAPTPGRAEQVYEGLKGKEGFEVYRRDEIPEHFHYKSGKHVQDILVVAKPTHYIKGIQSPKQIPRDPPESVVRGVHGYGNTPEMRTIFFARGPDFQKSHVHTPIQLVDVYQIFTHLLEIPSAPHNGSWNRVSGMLIPKSKIL